MVWGAPVGGAAGEEGPGPASFGPLGAAASFVDGFGGCEVAIACFCCAAEDAGWTTAAGERNTGSKRAFDCDSGFVARVSASAAG